jgi:hypothetical protein
LGPGGRGGGTRHAGMSHEDPRPLGTGYAQGELAKAFIAAFTHDDPQVRADAESRMRRWGQVIAGMLSGRLSIGSRRPVADLPVWVTPEVIRGGFATGSAAAGGPLSADEAEIARRCQVPADRAQLFQRFLTEAGVADLVGFLERRTYRVEVPEEAALLTVAWLVSAGDAAAAAALVERIAPFADRLRFLPRPAGTAMPEPGVVWRETAAEAATALRRRRPNARVAAMKEALTVWAPFGDELLALWLDTVEDGRVGATITDQWRRSAARLLARYAELAREHTLCSKHRKPKENLAILRKALEVVAGGRPLLPRERGLLQHAVDAMVARRGAPGSPRHDELRRHQRDLAARPTHHAIAQTLAQRLEREPRDRGVADVDRLLGPVTADEADPGMPEGTAVPPALSGVGRRCTAASLDELVGAGVIPSAEVLAGLSAQVSADVVAAAYPDESLRTLIAANYRAFRRRRTLLLVNLEKQVQLEELPWVQAVAAHRDAGSGTRWQRATATRLAELSVAYFPGTLLPNRMVRELDSLCGAADVAIPLLEELAADIFMGAFSAKFLRAAKVAARLLDGSLYATYYGIDYRAILDLPESGRPSRIGEPAGFADVCARRAGSPRTSSVAANGTVIEQGQVVTTQNLAALVAVLGIQPAPGWEDLARRSFRAVGRQVARVHDNPRPLRTVKDAAYAWRNTVFYLSMLPADRTPAFTAWAHDEVRRLARHDQLRLAPVLDGLDAAVAGRPRPASGPLAPFLGWTTSRHWMTDPSLLDQDVSGVRGG